MKIIALLLFVFSLFTIGCENEAELTVRTNCPNGGNTYKVVNNGDDVKFKEGSECKIYFSATGGGEKKYTYLFNPTDNSGSEVGIDEPMSLGFYEYVPHKEGKMTFVVKDDCNVEIGRISITISKDS